MSNTISSTPRALSTPRARPSATNANAEANLVQDVFTPSFNFNSGIYDRRTMSALMNDPKKKGGYKAPDEKDWHPKTNEDSRRTPEVKIRQMAVVDQATRTGKPQKFVTASGKEVTVSVTRSDDENVSIKIGDQKPISVWFDPVYGKLEQEDALARMLDYRAETPKNYRRVNSIGVYANDGTLNQASYNSSNRRMEYNGIKNVNQQVRDHEQGHEVGRGENSRTLIPSGWGKAVEADAKAISGYGKTSLVDDFAESWSAYAEARREGPKAVEELRQKYPERTRVLEEIWKEGEREKGTIENLWDWFQSGESTSVNVIEKPIEGRLLSTGMTFGVDPSVHGNDSRQLRDQLLAEMGFEPHHIENYWKRYPTDPKTNKPIDNGFRISDTSDSAQDWATTEQVKSWPRDEAGMTEISVDFETLKGLKKFYIEQKQLDEQRNSIEDLGVPVAVPPGISPQGPPRQGQLT